MQLSRIFFSGAFSEHREFIQSYPHIVQNFRPREFVWTPGQYMDDLYYITKGQTQSVILHEGGMERIFAFWGKDEFYPLACRKWEYNTERFIALRTITEVTVLRITIDTFTQMVRENPDFAVTCIDRCCRFSNSQMYTATLSSFEMPQTRLCSLFYSYLVFLPNPNNEITLSQTEIASIIGTSKISVARSMAKLRADGILTTGKGKVRILDMEKLLRHSTEYYKEKF